MADADTEYTAWLKHHPAPDLQELVEHYGGYHLIPAWAWEQYDHRMAAWQTSAHATLEVDLSRRSPGS